jgi:hypothetical protein
MALPLCHSQHLVMLYGQYGSGHWCVFKSNYLILSNLNFAHV